MLRSALLTASRSPACRAVAERSPLLRPVVDRFVAGTAISDALRVARTLAPERLVSLDHLGEDTLDRTQAERTVEAYHRAVRHLAEAGLATQVEVSVKLSALGQALPADGEKIALENTRRICAVAAGVGMTVTVDMEDHTTTDSTLAVVRELRADFPGTGAVLQAYLKRTEADCVDLAGPNSRVRLCKGAYNEPASVAYRSKHEVDLSYARCLRILMSGQGYPMVATHDPRLITLATTLAEQAEREPRDYELQMLYGVRPQAQADLARRGLRMRVYVPYGIQWYPYFMRRLAERPANLTFFLRALGLGS